MSIKLENISYVYSPGTAYEHHALKDVSLEIPQGQFVGIIGHTGSGKSTLIQHLNGLMKATSGKLLYEGQNIYEDGYDMKKLRTQVGLVFQYPEYQLFEVDVLSDVCFGPKNQGLSKEECEKQAREALELVGFPEKYYKQSPFELSGGQKRRVAIAGILAMHPKVLVLDEPTAGLDPKGRDEILDQVKLLHEKTGMTVILVSHSMEDVAKYVERLIVMNDGEKMLDGTPEEVFRRIEQHRFDLLFTDIQMPSMNGFDVLKNIRSLNPHAHAQLPVVAITARNDMQEAFFRKHGFATCLYKPFNQKDLAQAIRKALGDVRPEVKEEPEKAEAAPSSASPVIDLTPLTEFAGDDREAAQEILNTFLQETLLHAEAFKRAYEQKEKAEICRIAHKLLPTFTLVGAPCIKALQTLEQRRDEQEWNDADNVPAQEVIESFHLVVRALKEKNGSEPTRKHEY